MIWTEGLWDHAVEYCEILFPVCTFYSKKHRTSISRLSSSVTTSTNIAHSRGLRHLCKKDRPQLFAANTSSGDFWATMRLVLNNIFFFSKGRLLDCGRRETGLLLFVGARKTRSGW
ncbi:hypothetical protein COCVIDRAFT_34352 [Bipolaris victoriae FI3]|uniref:Uncharacterized protein n=1 Tax=Bipolaris victoriae (strain FI3) TaxID=930091 RepID=W7EZ10_BIPV3|nr:hypothetical protein COCVIDRAFT_34352 [Bipolaris victoriae FI3]